MFIPPNRMGGVTMGFVRASATFFLADIVLGKASWSRILSRPGICVSISRVHDQGKGMSRKLKPYPLLAHPEDCAAIPFSSLALQAFAALQLAVEESYRTLVVQDRRRGQASTSLSRVHGLAASRDFTRPSWHSGHQVGLTSSDSFTELVASCKAAIQNNRSRTSASIILSPSLFIRSATAES